jgi:hypothetical protein
MKKNWTICSSCKKPCGSEENPAMVYGRCSKCWDNQVYGINANNEGLGHAGITVQERGWAGHFFASRFCKFRRNTLISFHTGKIVVSTVGNYEVPGFTDNPMKFGDGYYYETMAFMAKTGDPYDDADVGKEIPVCGKDRINKMTELADIEANEMHDNAVKEIVSMISTYQVIFGKNSSPYNIPQ